MRKGNNRLPLTFMVILILLTLEGCSKLLDKKSDLTQVVPTTIPDLQALLDEGGTMNFSTPNIAQASCDEYFVTEDAYNSSSTFDQKIYMWDPIDYNSFPNDWSYSYAAIYNTNITLEQIQKINKTESNKSEWNNVIGSAYFFRAFHQLNLAWTFAKAYTEASAAADLGIVLRTGSNFHVPSIRASVKQSYESIILDAMLSVTYLPEKSIHVMRPSKVAAYGLLARIYLSMGKYDSALKYSDQCLKIKNTLMDFKSGGEGIIGINEYTPFNRFNPETIFYSQMATLNSISFNSIALIDTTIVNAYSVNDLRKDAYFYLMDNGYYQFKGNYTEGFEMFTGLSTDEIYLIRAECFARKDDKEKALEDLNRLLVNRYNSNFEPITTESSTQALEIIINERKKELLQRGLRWIDIKRQNVEGKDIRIKRIVGSKTKELLPNDKRYALPLPNDIISQTGIPQN